MTQHQFVIKEKHPLRIKNNRMTAPSTMTAV